MRARHSTRISDSRDDFYDFLVHIRRLFIHFLGERVVLASIGGLVPITGQSPARHRTPRNDSDALVRAQRQHFALFFAIDKIVLRLHRDESSPAMSLRSMLHLG